MKYFFTETVSETELSTVSRQQKTQDISPVNVLDPQIEPQRQRMKISEQFGDRHFWYMPTFINIFTDL